MKFLHLPIGQRFQYRSEWLRKIDVLTATPEYGDGGRRVIPRSAEVQVAADGEPAPPPAQIAVIDDAFLAFRARIQTAVDAAASELGAYQLRALRSEIEAAAEALRAAIDNFRQES